MSDTLYRPPEAPVSDEADASSYAGKGTFEVGQCLSEAWQSTWRNLVPWLGVLALTLVMSFGSLVVGVLLARSGNALPTPAEALYGLLVMIGFAFLAPGLLWGFLHFGLNALDGRARVLDVFSGFRGFWWKWWQVLVLMLCLILISLPGNLGQLLPLVGVEGWIRVGIDYAFSLLWALTVNLRFYLAPLFLVDRALLPWQALARSWQVTRGHVLRCAALAVLNTVVVIAGVLALGIGLIPAVLMGWLLWVSAYRQLMGRGPLTASPAA